MFMESEKHKQSPNAYVSHNLEIRNENVIEPTL